MPFLIAFAGWHNSGKTTVAMQVAGHLHSQGFRVGVIKSTKERDIAPERQHSDTSRYSEAGAKRVALVAPDVLIVRESEARRDPVILARNLFADMDIVLVEGFKKAKGLVKIEVRRQGISEPPISTGKAGDEVIALVCDSIENNPAQESLPCFKSADIAGISRFILTLYGQHRQNYTCTLLVNGQEHPLPLALQQELQALLQSSLLLPNQAQTQAIVFDLHCRIPVRKKS